MMPSRLVSPPCDFAQSTVASRSANSSASGLALTIGISFCMIVDLGEVDAGAEIIIGRDRERAQMRQPPGDVADVFVHAEDLHGDQDDRRVRHIGGLGEVDRHVAARDLDLGVADREAVGVGLDGVGAHRAGERAYSRRRRRPSSS